MNDQLHRSFIDLVSFDQKIHAVEEELKLLRNSLKEIDDQSGALTLSLEDMKRQVHDLKKNVDEQELCMKVLDQQEAEKKRLLDFVSGSKEYSALKSEINSINEQQGSTESTLIDAWDQFELAQKKFKAHEQYVQDKLNEFVHVKKDLNRKIESVLLTLDDLNSQRVSFRLAVPEELLENYEHMRKLVSNAVVPVVQGSCSACFYAVPGQDMGSLKRGILLPCKSCYRILFMEQVSE